MRRTKKFAASLFASGILAAGLAAPTASAQPVVTGGLVNVTIVDLLDVRDVNVGVGVAANIAATLCDTADINAAVLATQVVRGGQDVRCETDTGNITFSPVQR
jgi:hypothetical protein